MEEEAPAKIPDEFVDVETSEMQLAIFMTGS